MYAVTVSKTFDLPENYCWIQGGTALNGAIPGILHDDDFEGNLSLKNPYFGEYTAYYAIWKNDQDSDYIGLCHYRRFFDEGQFRLSPISAGHIERILRKKDVILPFQEGIGPIEEQYAHYHKAEDWRTYLEVLKAYDPGFQAYFSRYVKRRSEISMRNVLIGRREVIFAYFTWVFPLFERLETALDLEHLEAKDRRIPGFLIERTMEAWFVYYRYSIRYRYIYNTDESGNEKQRLRKSLYQIVRNLKFRNEVQK